MALQTRGIFSLREIYRNDRKGIGYPVSDVFTSSTESAGPNTGYTFGGIVPGPFPNPGTKSVCYKIDFSDDTIARVPGGDQPVASNGTASILPTYTAIYQMGGVQPASPYYTSSMFKMSYSDETNANVPGGVLSGIRYLGAHVYDGSSAGYTIAGANSGFVSITDKTTYSSETTARVPSADLPRSNNRVGSVGSPTNGYIIGGNPVNSNITKFTYSSEAMANSPTQFTPANTQGASGTSNTTTGYLQAGTASTKFTKLSFSDDSVSALPATIPTNSSHGDPSASSDNDTHGYYAISSGPSADPSSQVFKLNFSTESVSTLSATIYASGLRQSRGGGGRSFSLPGQVRTTTSQFKTGSLQGPNTGYYAGGQPGPMSTVEKCDFTTETTSDSPSSYLSAGRVYLGSAGNVTHGYFGGGQSPGVTRVSIVDKLTYATDTTAYTPAADLTTVRRGVAGFGNQTQGYFGAGQSPSAATSIVDKCTYSSDTTVRIPGADTGVDRYFFGGTGNQNVGYFAGGNSPSGYRSSIEKMDYSLETCSLVPSAPLSAARAYLTGTSNKTHAYFNGTGSPQASQTEKIEYSTDTIEYKDSMRIASSWGQGGSGNSEAGYFGGNAASPSYLMLKMDYIGETAAAVPSAFMNVQRYACAAVGSRDFGSDQQPLPTPTLQRVGRGPNNAYFGGGNQGSATNSSVMNKLNFSTDVNVRIVSGDLTVARWSIGAVANSTAGYFGGGYDGSSNRSLTDKLTLSNDTTARAPGADQPAYTNNYTAVGNEAEGYFAGGSPVGTAVTKLIYSNDTQTSLPTGAYMTASRWGLAGAGTADVGYFISGYGAVIDSRVDKITYSSDTTARVPSADVTLPRYYVTATGSSDAAYVGQGFHPTYQSAVEKLTYSDETSARIPTADLSYLTFGRNATGSNDAGYWAGGYDSGTVIRTETDKITYSTDTKSINPSSNLAAASYTGAGASSRANGNTAPVNC